MTKWQVFSAVALRRLPELLPKRDQIEIKVQHTFDLWENAKSRYSKHELRHLEDKRLEGGEDNNVIIKETAQDIEDVWLKEKAKFQFSEHDDRLSKTQYLFMKIKFGTDSKEQWLLPQAQFDRKLGDIDLMDTARRALKESLNIVNGYRILSKIPSSVYSFKYPKKVASMTGHDGAKVFFIKADLDLPDASALQAIDSTKSDKITWVTRDEALDIVKRKYMMDFSRGLLHEKRVDVNKVLKHAAQYALTMKLSVQEAQN